VQLLTAYQIFFLSPRNDAETHLYLLRASHCRVFLCPPATRAILAPVFATSLLPVLDIDGLDFWLDATPARHYPYIKTYAEAKADPHVIIHSSGSTGRPKLVVARNGQFTTLDAFLNLPKYAGRLSVLQFLNTANKIYNVFPPFHIAGIMSVYAVSIYGTASLIFGPSSPSFNTETILNVLDSSGADGAILPPSFIEPLGEMPEGLRTLSKLKYIAYAGAPLSRAAGGFLSATAVRLVNSLGSSECGNLDSVLPDPEDYDYLYWPHEHNHLGIEWRPTSDPDVFAQVFVRDKSLSATQGVFHTFPDLNEYATSDLFRRHPTKLDHWLYEGRLDDIIVFTTGEKMNPLRVEDAARGHPFVSAALVVGQHRFQPALLVELEPEVDLGQEQATAIRNAIWEIVRQANAKTPAYGQIAESYVASIEVLLDT
jgi:acyl-coenzyme A synthetase/AMP-(fatty) acid ligase